MSVLLLLIGMVLGAALMLVLLYRSTLTDEGQRIVARMEAEQRIRDVETRALHAMAAAAEQAVHEAAHPATWPSEERAVEGTAVEITTKET
jgi:hypothetical protein